MRSFVLIILVLSIASPAEARQHRSNAARHAFAQANVCPATGQPRLPCPGYIIDHIIPLCAGGEDAPLNMQWQTVADAKLKDQLERKQCLPAK